MAFRGCRNCTQSSDGAIGERTRQAPTDVCREPTAHRTPNAQVQGLMSAHKYGTVNAPDLREQPNELEGSTNRARFPEGALTIRSRARC